MTIGAERWLAGLFEMMQKHIGVRYVYEGTEDEDTEAPNQRDEFTPDTLKHLPSDLLKQLNEAALDANIIRVDELIEEAETYHAVAASGLGKCLSQRRQAR